eukprot:CAMPEP_0115859376 /NCGR_PEP_ID=MMETSP0287-20121206/16584_1 /TAXON_ID=412157 /ORGANISM="Chrysochromulina rotalis, Strain UIO044" /LENGTH=176 /DNA_ID=CAMNT_0003313675 /DNA_START=115 /DNA_END=645 /DNA_ORIENTATION=-
MYYGTKMDASSALTPTALFIAGKTRCYCHPCRRRAISSQGEHAVRMSSSTRVQQAGDAKSVLVSSHAQASSHGVHQVHNAIQLLQWHRFWLQDEMQLSTHPPNWTQNDILTLISTATEALRQSTEQQIDQILMSISKMPQSSKSSCVLQDDAAVHDTQDDCCSGSDAEPLMFEMEV